MQLIQFINSKFDGDCIMNNQNQNMENKIRDFHNRYGDYFRGSISDEDMTEYVSQPFWQSPYLSKKRLNKNGLTINFTVKSAKNR